MLALLARPISLLKLCIANNTSRLNIMCFKNNYQTRNLKGSRVNSPCDKHRLFCNSACICLFYLPYTWLNQPPSIHLKSFKCTPLKPRSTPIPTHTYLYIYPWGNGSVNNCVLVFYWLGVWKPGFGWFASVKLIFEQPVWLIFI